MKFLFALLRLAAAVLTIIAIAVTFTVTAQNATINPFNFFGFFTIQSNIIVAVVYLIAVFATFAGRAQTPNIVLLRGAATSYIVLVGLVYNTLLVGQAGGVPVAWANTVLHVIVPIYAALDWVFFGDRTALPWKKLVYVLTFPVIWLIVVIIRGATDGWVPYPFLDPAQGYGVVALFAVGIAVAFVATGALVWALSRVKILTP